MWAVIIVVAVLLIVFVVSVLLKMKREPKPEVQAVQPAPAKDPEAAARRAWLSANYFAEAKARATLGDYTEAIRFLFLALVFRFDEEGRVGFHKEYTNREYLDLLGDQRKVRTSLGLLVDTLDVHWYGQQACTRQQYEECLEVYGRLAE
jgi:tetratricopeptide (TPR) repeat protein